MANFKPRDIFSDEDLKIKINVTNLSEVNKLLSDLSEYGKSLSDDMANSIRENLGKVRDSINTALHEDANLNSVRINNIFKGVERLKNQGKTIDEAFNSITGVEPTALASLKEAYNAQEELNDALENERNLHQANVAEINKEVKAQKEFIRVVKEGLKPLAKVWEMWKSIDDASIKHIRSLGMSGENMDKYRAHMIQTTSEMAKKFGMTHKELMALNEGYTKATGKAQLFSQAQIKGAAALTKAVGQETWQSMADNFDALGGSTQTANAHLATTFAKASNAGLNASKTSAAFANNLKLAASYNFRDGVEGVRRMTILTESMRINMQQLAQATEKFETIEGAIETSARLQMLGGSFAANFSNPLTAMNESLTDTEGLMNRILDSFKGRAFIGKDGMMKMSYVDRRLLKEAAKAAGLNPDDMFNMVSNDARSRDIRKSFGGAWDKFTESQQLALANKAQKNSKTGEYEITLADGSTKKLTEITADNVDNIIKQLNVDKHIDNNLQLLVDHIVKNKSWNESIQGMEESAYAWGAQAIPGSLLRSGANWASGLNSGLLFGGIGADNLVSMYIGSVLNSGSLLKGSSWTAPLRKIRGRFGGGGTSGGGSVTNPSSPTSTPLFDTNTRRVEDSAPTAKGKANAKAAKPNLMKGGAPGKFAKGSKNVFAKVGKRLSGKGGKIAAVASLAMLAGSMFMGGNDAKAAEPQGTGGGDNVNDDDGNPIVREQKITNKFLEAMAAKMGILDVIKSNQEDSRSEEEGDGVVSSAFNTVQNGLMYGGMAAQGAGWVAGKMGNEAIASTFKSIGGKALAKGGAGFGLSLGGTLLQAGGDYLKESGHEGWGAAANIGGKALEYAGYGKMFGGTGALIGAGVGAIEGGKDELQNYLKEKGHDGLIGSKGVGILARAGQGALIGAGIGSFFGGIGAGPGAAIGAALGGAVGVVQEYSEEIKAFGKKTWKGVKNIGKAILGMETDAQKERREQIESTYAAMTISPTDDATTVTAKAAVSIQHMLADYFKRDLLGDDKKGRSGGIFSNAIKAISAPLVTPLAVAGAIPTMVSRRSSNAYVENPRNRYNPRNYGAQSTSIDLNINGTIKLTGANGQSTQIDPQMMKQLFNNVQFKKQLVEMVLEGMREKANAGRRNNDRDGSTNVQSTTRALF